MIILGINYYFHDSSAALVIDGELIVAFEEERFTRNKHTREFPDNAIRECLRIGGIDTDQIDHVAVSTKPTHCWQKTFAYAMKKPHKAAPFIKHELINGYFKQRRFKQWVSDTFPTTKKPNIAFIEHHLSHAAGSFFVSPYEDAAIIAIDGSSEWASAWLGHGKANQVTCFNESEFPHSLGSVYESVTEFCGFKPNYDEGKTMGLAPLGDASRFIKQARKTVNISDEEQIEVDLSYFSYQYWGYKRYAQKFHDVLGEPRVMDSDFETHHHDVAAAFQLLLEECALKMAAFLKHKTNASHLVIAGGVALNSVMNGRLLREAGFEDVYIMPAAGDNSTSIGAAYTLLHQKLNQPRRFVHDNPYVGNEYSDDAVETTLKQFKLNYKMCADIAQETPVLLENGKIGEWFQGRMEISPRALGLRSIVTNPAFPDMKDEINAEVKFRETYRPFAPSATVEAAQECL